MGLDGAGSVGVAGLSAIKNSSTYHPSKTKRRRSEKEDEQGQRAAKKKIRVSYTLRPSQSSTRQFTAHA